MLLASLILERVAVLLPLSRVIFGIFWMRSNLFAVLGLHNRISTLLASRSRPWWKGLTLPLCTLTKPKVSRRTSSQTSFPFEGSSEENLLGPSGSWSSPWFFEASGLSFPWTLADSLPVPHCNLTYLHIYLNFLPLLAFMRSAARRRAAACHACNASTAFPRAAMALFTSSRTPLKPGVRPPTSFPTLAMPLEHSQSILVGPRCSFSDFFGLFCPPSPFTQQTT